MKFTLPSERRERSSKVVKVHSALYDPASIASDQNYWSWRSPDLDLKLLQQLYFKYVKFDLPSEINQLEPTAIWGGIATFSRDWVFAWRIFDGGRDRQQRPGRFVVAVAAVRRSEVRGADLTPLLTGPQFQHVSHRAATECPLSRPASMIADLSFADAAAVEGEVEPVLSASKPCEFHGGRALERSLATASSQSSESEWILRIRICRAESKATLSLHSIDSSKPTNQSSDQAPLPVDAPTATPTKTSKPAASTAMKRFTALRIVVYGVIATAAALVIAIAISRFYMSIYSEHTANQMGRPDVSRDQSNRKPWIEHQQSISKPLEVDKAESATPVPESKPQTIDTARLPAPEYIRWFLAGIVIGIVIGVVISHVGWRSFSRIVSSLVHLRRNHK